MKILVSIISIFLISSCVEKEMKFTKELWNFDEDAFYPKRKYVVKDLIKNHLKKGMKYEEWTNLIGEPFSLEKTQRKIKYDIEQIWGWNIDPKSGSYLEIYVNKDSTLKEFKKIDW